MADEKKIIEISVDNDAAIQEIIRLREETAKLKDTEGLTKEQIEANRIATQEYNQQIRSLQKEVQNSIKTDQQKEGSLSQMKAQVSNLTKEYNDLSRQERESAKGRELQAKIKGLTDELKDAESAIGDNRRKVGDYAGEIGKLGGTLSAIPGPIGKMAGGIGGATSAFKAFNLTNPVGWVTTLISLLTSLTGKLKANKEMTELMAKASGALNGIISFFNKIIVDAVKSVSDFIGSIKSFPDLLKRVGDAVKENLINRLESFSVIGKAIVKILKGDLKGGFQQLADGMIQNVTGIEKATGKLSSGIGAIGKSIAEATKEGSQLAALEKRFETANRNSQKLQLQYQYEAERLRQVRDDESLTIEQRVKANEDLGKVLQKQIKDESNIANLQIQIARMRIKQNGETKENLDELAEAETRLIDIKERIAGQESEQLVNINSLRREAEVKAKEDAKKKAEIEKQKQDELLAIKKAADDELDRLFEESEKEMAALEVFEQERVKTKLQIENDSRFELKRQQYDNEFDLLRIELEKQYAQQIAAAEKVGADTTNITALYERAKTEIQKEETSARLDLVAGLAGDIAQLFGEGTVVGKMAASAQTAINTYQAAMGAYAHATPLLGPIGGAIAAGIATAAGIKAIKNIWAVKSGLPSDSNSASSSVRLTSVTPATPDTTARIASPLTPIISPTGSAAITSGAATSISTGAADPLRIMQNMPAPIVTVKDIDIAQNRVKVTDSLAKI